MTADASVLPGGLNARLAEPVAIVGMGAVFPGADSLDTYWQNLTKGVDSISEAPANRWDPEWYDPSLADKPSRLYCRRGGFIDEFASFDPLRFGVMPTSVPETEPEQLLALRVVSEAIEDAGGMDRLPDRSRVGVIFGRLGQSSVAGIKFFYRVMLEDMLTGFLTELRPGMAAEEIARFQQRIEERLGTYHAENVMGLMPNLTASRVANRLDLRGPAYILDAACASSLIALDHGIAGLMSGGIDTAIVGGVHLNQDITFWAVFNQLKALSRSQQIRPFDTRADGLLIGEGLGAIVLKRLSDATRNGDRIYAVVRGIGVSSDGRSASLVNPEKSGQVLAIRRAWASAGGAPADSVGLLEAHGTGTPVGDATELSSIAEVFGNARKGTAPVIGSVKSMIGHTMPAAGAASLIKAALAVSNGVLLPTLHCDSPRPELGRSRFEVLTATRPWDLPGQRRAAVNAFGFGGINVHVIIEQAPEAAGARPRRARRPALARVREPEPFLLLEARNVAELSALLDGDDHDVRARATIPSTPPGSGTGNARGPRLGLIGPTPERLGAARKIAAAGRAWRGGRDIWFSPFPLLADADSKLAFVYPGLEAELAHSLDDVADHFRLPRVDIQPADFTGRFTGVMAISLLLKDALGHIGITADAMAGHSLGEWTAGLAAGLADGPLLDQAAALLFDPSWERKDLQHAVIGTGAESLAAVLPGYPGVDMSHDNAPGQSVVCGPVDQVNRLLAELGASGVICRPLPFTTGIHTQYLQPAIDRARAEIDRLWPVSQEGEQVAGWRGAVQIWSATSAAPLTPDARRQRELFFRHLVEKVRFRETIMAMHDAGIRAFIQVGTGQLDAVIHDNLRDREHLVVPAHVGFREGLPQLRRVATALWTEGHDPDFLAFYPDAPPRPAPGSGRQGTPVRVELGTERTTLGPGAEALIDMGTRGKDARAVAAAGPATVNLAGANLAGRGAAAAEFAALLADTAELTASVLSAAGRPAAVTPTAALAPAPAIGIGERCTSVLRLSLKTMPYLIDHSFNSLPAGWPHPKDRNPVVAGTTIVQHMIDAVETAAPGWHVIRVLDVQFRFWALIEPAQDMTIEVTRTSAQEFSVSFGKCAAGRLLVAPDYPENPPDLWRFDKTEERPSPLSATDLYAKRIMFHGPRFRALVAVHAVGTGHVRGLLRTLTPPGALLDGGMQLMSIWTHLMLTDRSVLFPHRFENIQFFGPQPPAGEAVECVCRVREIRERALTIEIQMVCRGSLWAQLECVIRRFDSHPRSRAAETMPGRHTFATGQPGGWATCFDYWPDPASQNSIVTLVSGIDGWDEYASKPVAQRKGWLLGRLATKDAVRMRVWESEPGREIFPIEVAVSDTDAGRPTVSGWEGLCVPELDVSAAYTRNIGVAIARLGAHVPGSGAGIGVVEVASDGDTRAAAIARTGHGDLEQACIRLSDDELAVLEHALARKEFAGDRARLAAAFAAAKAAASRSAGVYDSRAGAVPAAVIGVTESEIAVDVSGRRHQISYQEVKPPEELPAQRYVVAWTPDSSKSSAPSHHEGA
jgi:acyl transferase domain-containing protein